MIKMRNACEADHNSNKNGKPAFERFKMLKTIDIALQRPEVCCTFIDKDGLNELAFWLEQMPDKTFPNAKIVSTILTCIDRLPFDLEHIQDPELFENMENCLRMYK